jgi:subtilisin-like proprotein convertase family protein
MKMKSMMAVVLLAAGAAAAQTFNTNLTFNVNQAIPDADNNGLALAQTLALPTLLGGPISDVTVTLDISGGFNGDLYAYLAGPNGGFAVLLNRTGVSSGNAFGSSASGFNNITLDDSASYANIHTSALSGVAVMGTYNSDGENIDPQSPAGDFPAGATALLTSFNGNAADGTWTLFLADLSAGGQSTIVSWGLDITAVPEPASLTLAALGGIAILALRQRRL